MSCDERGRESGPAHVGPLDCTRGGLSVRIQLPAFVIGLGALLLVAPCAAGDLPRKAAEALTACRGVESALSRRLLCLDLQARRPAESHAGYYGALDALDSTVVRQLPRDPTRWPSRDILGLLHHAQRPKTRYEIAVTLVDVLDRRRDDPRSTLAADCDLFCFLNVGATERYYGPGRRAVGILRTSYDHLVNASLEDGRITGVLETVDGSVHELATRRDERWLSREMPGRPMSESEIVALYLANIGLALQIDGHHAVALSYFDAALELNREEFVAHVGLALALLLEAAKTDSDGALALLERAESAAKAALALEPRADGPYAVLGRVKLRSRAPASAQLYLEQAAALRPDPVHHYYLTLALAAQQKYGEAIDAAQRGRRLIGDDDDSRYGALRVEMEYLLALAYAQRAEKDRSPSDLRKAMDLFSPVAALRPDDDAVRQLGDWIDRVDHEIGPVRRELGIRRPGGTAMDASLRK